MKKLLTILLYLVHCLAFANANDLAVMQRNSTDTGYLTRIIASPSGSANGVIFFNGTTLLPEYFTFGSGLTLSSGVLSANAAPDQVQTDWNATTGLAKILNRPTISTVGMTGNFGDLNSLPTTLSGYGITDAYPLAGNPSGFLTGITGAQVTTALGITPVDQVGARGAVSLTTTGTTGAATYNSVTGVLNVPSYTSSGGTVTSVVAGSGLSGGTITTTGTISMPSVGTAGTYSGVTTDAQGRVTAGTTPSQSSATRTLNTAFQINASRGSMAIYSVRITTTVSIGSNQDGDVILEIASDSGFTTNVQTLSIGENGQTVTLAIALNSVQAQTVVVSGYVPAGYYARLRTVNNTGTPAYLYRSGQEILM